MKNEGEPREPKHWRARLALGTIATVAVVYDYFCPPGEMISEEIDYLRESDRYGQVTHEVLDALYHHFKRDVPPEEDRIHQLARLINKD